MSVPRPTPTRWARAFHVFGNRIDRIATPANASSPIRRRAWVRAPRPRMSRNMTAMTAAMRSIWIRTIFMGALSCSAEKQIGQAVDRVPQRLALRLGVVGVEDVHRHLGIGHLG